jgi:hypothetical protein
MASTPCSPRLRPPVQPGRSSRQLDGSALDLHQLRPRTARQTESNPSKPCLIFLPPPTQRGSKPCLFFWPPPPVIIWTRFTKLEYLILNHYEGTASRRTCVRKRVALLGVALLRRERGHVDRRPVRPRARSRTVYGRQERRSMVRRVQTPSDAPFRDDFVSVMCGRRSSTVGEPRPIGLP